MADDRIPTSRIGRSVRMSRLAAEQAARQLGTHAANLTRSEQEKRAALERRHVEAAEQIVTALGTMKGAAMKLGQVLSFMDIPFIDPQYREEFQEKLAVLRNAAPKVRFSEMRKVLESNLEAPITEVFSEFYPDPVAAASIGQVYRARLHNGREVAVKVQYPGVAQAVRADLQNLKMILYLMKRIAPGLDVAGTAEEIKMRIGDELDYELEAQNQRTLARIYRDHPFIFVPDVISSLSREHVLVSEFVHGTSFEEVKQMDDSVKDRVGEIIFRFYFGSMYRHGQFSGDPHPGNCLLRDDRSVAFFDFGLFKVLPKNLLELEIECLKAANESDTDRLYLALRQANALPNPERFDPEKLLSQIRRSTWWYLTDEKIQLEPEVATQVILELSDPRSQFFDQVRHETLPADHIFGRRMEMLTLAVLGQLRASANWHRIVREWIYQDESSTDLGRSETAFFDRD